MIAVENLSVRAGSFALDGLSFVVPTGQYAVLMGKTGTGKTTVLEALCGLKPALAGRIRLAGLDVTQVKTANRGIGYVPQDRALFPSMTVREHLAFALLIRCWPAPEIEKRVNELARLLHLERLLERGPQRLSGGEQQRVALGRALAARPGILLLDEPLSALDEETREGMADLLKSIQEATGVTTLHVTHSLSEANRLADQLLILRDGVVHAETLNGSPQGNSIRATP